MHKQYANQYSEIIDIKELNRRCLALENIWKDFLESEGESNLEYYVHKKNLFEVVKRQDQRMRYLEYFHGLDYPCEYKYMAIECFWLITLKPFMVIDNNSSLYDAPNEKFSLFLILSTINTVYAIYNPDKKFIPPSIERIRDILYDFKYCSMSREAIISFVETFADTYGVGIEFILNHKNTIMKKLKQKPLFQIFGNFMDKYMDEDEPDNT